MVINVCILALHVCASVFLCFCVQTCACCVYLYEMMSSIYCHPTLQGQTGQTCVCWKELWAYASAIILEEFGWNIHHLT